MSNYDAEMVNAMKLLEEMSNRVNEIDYDEVIAIDFSEDIDKPSKYQTKDGNWHDSFTIDLPKGDNT